MTVDMASNLTGPLGKGEGQERSTPDKLVISACNRRGCTGKRAPFPWQVGQGRLCEGLCMLVGSLQEVALQAL